MIGKSRPQKSASVIRPLFHFQRLRRQRSAWRLPARAPVRPFPRLRYLVMGNRRKGIWLWAGQQLQTVKKTDTARPMAMMEMRKLAGALWMTAKIIGGKWIWEKIAS